MKRRPIMAALGLAAIAGAAQAQETHAVATQSPGAVTPGPFEETTHEIGTQAEDMFQRPERFFSERNLTVSLGAGYTDVTTSGTDGLIGAGGSWTLRGIFGADKALGLEGGYVGSAYPITALNGDAGTIITNGVEALGRLGFPIRGGDRRLGYILPYATAGLGLTLFNSTGVNHDVTRIDGYDFVFQIPAGFGISAGYDRLNLDLRFLYRAGFGSSMFDRATSTNTGGASTVSITAMAGYKF